MSDSKRLANGQERDGSTRDGILSAARDSFDSIQEMALSGPHDAAPLQEETDVQEDGGMPAGDPPDISESFAGLPIESLICAPIIAAAKGQQELVAVYVDGIKKLAYKQDANGKESDETNVLKMKIHKPVRQQDKGIEAKEYVIEAPLLSLVPVPAFVMDELDVDFNMEVKQEELSESKNHADAQTNVGYKSWWGVDAKISGNVSSDSMHRRSTDSSATYHIKARAVQQQPSEGMAKLTSILAASMEPLE